MDTQLRATLYSQSIGDRPDVQKTLRKNAFLQQHIHKLLTEKADISLQKINLKRKLQQAKERAEELDHELVMKQTDGDFSDDKDQREPPKRKSLSRCFLNILNV